jgi:alpha-galactosidase
MDGAVYQNDPDVVFLRSVNCALTETERELIALVNFLLAGQIFCSDAPHQLSPAGRALGRRMEELFDLLGDDEYGAVTLDRDVYRLESRSGKTAGLINLGNCPYPQSALSDPALRDLFATGRYLTDHRVKNRAGEWSFAPHSISIRV